MRVYLKEIKEKINNNKQKGEEDDDNEPISEPSSTD